MFIASAAAPESDVDLLEFPLNLEYLEAEFFLFGSLGYGLDVVAPNLTEGGPPPIGARLARLENLIRDIILQFGLQEVGHLRFCSVSSYSLQLQLFLGKNLRIFLCLNVNIYFNPTKSVYKIKVISHLYFILF